MSAIHSSATVGMVQDAARHAVDGLKRRVEYQAEEILAEGGRDAAAFWAELKRRMGW